MKDLAEFLGTVSVLGIVIAIAVAWITDFHLDSDTYRTYLGKCANNSAPTHESCGKWSEVGFVDFTVNQELGSVLAQAGNRPAATFNDCKIIDAKNFRCPGAAQVTGGKVDFGGEPDNVRPLHLPKWKWVKLHYVDGVPLSPPR